jgi:hypothetical protein
VEAYRITAALLTKLGEAELAWLAVDRAMNTARVDPIPKSTVRRELPMRTIEPVGVARRDLTGIRSARMIGFGMRYFIGPIGGRKSPCFRHVAGPLPLLE